MSLAVDKIKKKVRLTLADQSQMTGYVFLSPYSRIGDGSQTLLELLTGEERFVAFETTEGEYSFINYSQIVWLAIPLEEADPVHDPVAQTRSVSVFLRDGKMFRGHIIIATPEGKTRLSDRLNEIKGFMVLRDNTREVVININWVVRVL